eukprot:g3275.t1
MEGMYSSHKEMWKWKGEWFDAKDGQLRSRFSYQSTNWISAQLPCKICNSVDMENAFFCDMCDEAYHHKCIGWDKNQADPKNWYCKEFGRNCQKVIDGWGLMPASRIYKGSFRVYGQTQSMKESFVLRFKYLPNEQPPKDYEPCITAEVFGYGTNVYGKFVITGVLEVYNNVNAPALRDYLQFHKSNGKERYYFKLCVKKIYLSKQQIEKLGSQLELIAHDFADISALVRTTPAKPTVAITGEKNPQFLRKILNLEHRLNEQQLTVVNLKKKLADKTQEMKLRERQQQEEVARLAKSLRLAQTRSQQLSGTSDGSMSLSNIWRPARKNTLVVTDVDCYFHVNPKSHVEDNNRILTLWSHLNDTYGLRLSWKSNVNRVNLQTLLLAHDMEYLKLLFDVTQKLKHNSFIDIVQAKTDLVNSISLRNSSSSNSSDDSSLREKDTHLSGNFMGNTVAAALKSAGAVCDAIDAVMNGQYHNAFCVIRPPGHHAGRCGLPTGDLCGTGKLSQGFCVLNNVAIGAFHGIVKYRSLRVAVVDIDLHAGNGTQEIFESFLQTHPEFSNNILFSSIHQQDIFPFLSQTREVAAGVDPTRFINVGLSGKVDSTKWQNSFRVLILPKLKHFSPDLVLISAGFDGHKDDKSLVHNFELIDEDYHWIAQYISKHVCRNVVSVLEGGYFHESLRSSVSAHVRGLME